MTDRPGLNWAAASKGKAGEGSARKAPPKRGWPRWAVILLVAALAGGFDFAWFVLRPADRPAPDRDKATPSAQLAPTEPANLVEVQSPQIAFDEAKAANTVQAWDDFLAKVEAGDVQPGPLTGQARQERAKLIAAQATLPAFDEAKSANTVQAWDDFLSKADTGEVQRGPLVDEARKERAKLIATENTKAGFDQAKKANTIEAWDDFLAEVTAGTYQPGALADQARRERSKLIAAQSPQAAFDEAKAANTIEGWDTYLAKVKSGDIVGGALADRARRERGILLTGQLQSELRRVGCDPGPATTDWRDGSRHALDDYNKNAGTRFDIGAASPEALQSVRGQTSRVCPLICERGMRLEGETCVAIECNPDDATCEKPAAAAPSQAQSPSDSRPLQQEDLEEKPARQAQPGKKGSIASALLKGTRSRGRSRRASACCSARQGLASD